MTITQYTIIINFFDAEQPNFLRSIQTSLTYFFEYSIYNFNKIKPLRTGIPLFTFFYQKTLRGSFFVHFFNFFSHYVLGSQYSPIQKKIRLFSYRHMKTILCKRNSSCGRWKSLTVYRNTYLQNITIWKALLSY